MVTTRSSNNTRRFTTQSSGTNTSRNTIPVQTPVSSPPPPPQLRRSGRLAASSSSSLSSSTSPVQSVSQQASMTTSSFRDAAIRNYKVYRPSSSSRRNRSHTRESESSSSSSESSRSVSVSFEDYNIVDAANTLCSFRAKSEPDYSDNDDYVAADEPQLKHETEPEAEETETSQQHSGSTPGCINPMSPNMSYMYRLNIFDENGYQRYATSYIYYDNSTRRFNIVNNLPVAAGGSPFTLQTKYTSYIGEHIQIYVSQLLAPRHVACSISTDYIGLVISDKQQHKGIFGPDACFYDVDQLFTSTASTATLTGHEMFILVQTKHYRSNQNDDYILDLKDALTIIGTPQ